MAFLRWCLGTWFSNVVLMVLSVMLLVPYPWADQETAAAQIAYMAAFYAPRSLLWVLASALAAFGIKAAVRRAFRTVGTYAGYIISMASGFALMTLAVPEEPLFAVVGLVSAGLGELAAGTKAAGRKRCRTDGQLRTTL